MSNPVSTGGEVGEEPIGTELGMFHLRSGQMTGDPDSVSEGIGVLDKSNNLDGISGFALALVARGGGRLEKAFCLCPCLRGPCGFNSS